MSTNDVPGYNPANADVLAMGCWAAHDDGSLIHVEAVEAGTVVYSIFDVGADPPVEYRDAMPERGFKEQFSWDPDDDEDVRWTWHDKQPFDWSRVMVNFPAGQKHTSAVAQMTAAQRVAERLRLHAHAVTERHEQRPTMQRAARTIMQGITEAVRSLNPR